MDFMTPEQLRADFLSFEMLEDVSVSLRQSDDSFAEVVVVKGLSRPPRRRYGEPVTPVERVYHLDKASGLGTVTPGTRLVAGGQKWLVMSSSLESLETRWRCDCVREVV